MLTIITLLVVVAITFAILYIPGGKDMKNDVKRSGRSLTLFYMSWIFPVTLLSLMILFLLSLYGVIPHTTDTSYKHIDGRVYRMNQNYNLYGENIWLTPTSKDGSTVTKINGKYKYTGE